MIIMKTEIKILEFLIENRYGPTLREISQKLRIDYKITHTAAERLIKKGIVEKKRVGKSITLFIKNKFSNEIFEAEMKKRERVLLNQNIRAIYERLCELNFPFIAILFGSYSIGRQNKNSDIDIMVICEKSREQSVEETISLIPLKIHLIILEPKDFMNMARSKEFTVVSEANKNRVILSGIEDYYRLITNAEK